MEHRLFTTQQFLADGHSEMELRWGVKRGVYQRLRRSVYARGAEEATPFEESLAEVLASSAPARGVLAAQFHGLDGVSMPTEKLPLIRTAPVDDEPVLINGLWCVSGLQTMVDLAALVGPIVWEQANEAALHKKLFQLSQLEALVPELSARRTIGVGLIRDVLALRPPNAPPTESLLETLMVQLARSTDGVPEPTRQLVIRNEHDDFVARVDLAWPEEGGFHELDGQHHAGQPVYDANRQTEVAIVTGWLCGRFTWREVRHNPVATARRLQRFIAMAKRRRPV